MTQALASFSEQDYQFMQRAIELAKLGHYTTSPNPRVGCVIVKGNAIVGEGYHAKAGQGHAEVYALKQAGENAQGATAYVTLEPCSHYGRTPPCAQALVDAGVEQVIAAMVDPNPKVSGQGLELLKQAGIKVSSGLLEVEAQALNVGFVQLMRDKKPYIRCKLAASLDGKTAMESGESQWITSSSARQDVQRLRAQSCAIITGADSVLFDNAKMTVRWSELGQLADDYPEQSIRQPVRIIIDGKNRLTPDLAIFQQPSPVLVICAACSNDEQNHWPDFVEHIQLPFDGDYISLPAVIELLGERGLNDILIESGQRLAGAFIEQNLVDELILYQAPKLIGDRGKSLVAFEQITQLNEAKSMVITDTRMVGCDLRIQAQFITDKH